MGLLRSLIRKFWNKEQDDGIDFKNSQGILIKPDGTWVVSNPQKKTVYNPPNIIKMPSSPFVPGKDFLLYDTETGLETLSFPPDYFPHAKELYSKLEQCIDMDIISSCTHKQTQNNVYILSIEIPCGENQTESMRKFKQFIKAMEELYKLKNIQQERINSITCNDKHYLVIFEYDPKIHVMQKLNVDREED